MVRLAVLEKQAARQEKEGRLEEALMTRERLCTLLDPRATSPTEDSASKSATLESAIMSKDAQVALALAHRNAGVLLRKLGRHADALAHYQRCRELRAASLGTEHLQYAAALTGVGNSMRLLGREKEALPLLRECLAIREKAWGTDGKHLPLTLQVVADTLEALDQYHEALPLRKQCLSILARVHGPDHESTKAAKAALQACSEAAATGRDEFDAVREGDVHADESRSERGSPGAEVDASAGADGSVRDGAMAASGGASKETSK